MPKVILSQKLKNAIEKKIGHELVFNLKNTLINGEKRGCWGYISNPNNHVTVFVDTERSCLPSLGSLIRYAKNSKDSSGGRNRNGFHSLDDIVDEVVRMLNDRASWEKDLRL